MKKVIVILALILRVTQTLTQMKRKSLSPNLLLLIIQQNTPKETLFLTVEAIKVLIASKRI
jgi:hypothetical protein